jgi:cell division protein FtsW (lipid II flippase)
VPKNDNEQLVVKPSKWKNFKDTYFLVGSIDIPFLGLTIALLTIGLIMLFSASYPLRIIIRTVHITILFASLFLQLAALWECFSFQNLTIRY